MNEVIAVREEYDFSTARKNPYAKRLKNRLRSILTVIQLIISGMSPKKQAFPIKRLSICILPTARKTRKSCKCLGYNPQKYLTKTKKALKYNTHVSLCAALHPPGDAKSPVQTEQATALAAVGLGRRKRQQMSIAHLWDGCMFHRCFFIFRAWLRKAQGGNDANRELTG